MTRLAAPLLFALASCQAPVAVESYLAVLNISPPNGQGNVQLNTEVTVTFSEALVEGTLTDENIYLADSFGEKVDASLVYNDDFWTVFISPDDQLENGERYKIRLTTGLKGVDSGALATEITSEFSTSGSSTPTNQPPVADAGDDQTVVEGDTVSLDGSGSYDSDDDALTYLWELIDIPDASETELDDATLESPSFLADVAGVYVAMLTVSDGSIDSSPDYVQVEATPAEE